jgi:diguanylate cyclase (GGDEF)-like protein
MQSALFRRFQGESAVNQLHTRSEREPARPPRRASLLVASDRPDILAEVEDLAAERFFVTGAQGPSAALTALSSRAFDLLLADQQMEAMTGLELLEWSRWHFPRTARVLLASAAGTQQAERAVGRGDAFAYTHPPLQADGLLSLLNGAARESRRRRRLAKLMHGCRRYRQESEQGDSTRDTFLERAVALLRRDMAALEREGQRLRRRALEMGRLALTDPLTGLANRRAIELDADYEIRRRHRQPAPLAVGLVDADDFKEVNTHHLLPGGDQALIALAHTLTNAVRTTDRVGRLGGEEFLVIAPQTDPAGAAVLAERMRAAVEQTAVRYNGAQIGLTVSIGFAVVGANDQADLTVLLDLAAAALSDAKNSGRNCAFVRSLAPLGLWVSKPSPDS